MVKPPKTMQPEAIDLARAGRDKTKAFGEDSFHSYMARKIDQQRQQFGLMLPPAPPELREKDTESRVKFAPAADEKTHTTAAGAGGDEQNYSERSSKKKRTHKFGITAVLKRLQRRHGEHSKRKRRTEASCNSSVEFSQQSASPDLSQQQSTFFGAQEDESISAHGERILAAAEPSKELQPPPPQKPSAPQQDLKRRTDLFFMGVVVLVNGYTDPDTETLQRLLQRHGGDLERYETSRVTHIIATRLSHAKATMYAKRKTVPIVCRPAWIVDSIEAGKQLPVAEYLVIRDDILSGESGRTKSVASFFQAASKVDAKQQQQQQQQQQQCMERRSSISEGSSAKKQRLSMSGSRSSFGEAPHLSLESVDDDDDDDDGGGEVLDNFETFQRGEDILHERDIASQPTDPPENESLLAAEESTAAEAQQQSLPQTEMETSSGAAADQQKDRYIHGRVRTVGTDPTFLESFFAASRLSFIGSYKQRAKQSPTKSDVAPTVGDRYIFHVDMDCFFASVVLRNFPQYRNKPVVISHHGEKARSGSEHQNQPRDVPKESSSECATCNYEARKFGIKKGMYLGRAKALCPDLVILQYDFEGYEEVSDAVSDILERHALEKSGYVEHVSCDEAYVEFFLSTDKDKDGSSRSVARELAETIRQEIFERTQCTATVGVGRNKFLAKLATDHVKPDGSFVVDQPRDLLRPLQLRDLHGVGYRLEHKLAEEDLISVQDVWDLGHRGEQELCRILGPGLGKKIYGFCQGKDDRLVQPAERKTIGAECNYGVRFDGPYGVDHMVEGLCREVEKRMTTVGVKGLKITLKVKQRKKDAKPPPKFLGHGSCHSLSKCKAIANKPTRHWKCLYDIAILLYSEMKVPKEDIRGMGIVVSNLSGEKNLIKETHREKQNIANWFAKKPQEDEVFRTETPKKRKSVAFSLPADPMVDDETKQDGATEDRNDDNDNSVLDLSGDNTEAAGTGFAGYDFDIALPSLSQIHMSQVEELPSPMRRQIVSKMEATAKVNEEAPRPVDTRASPSQNHSRTYRQTDVKRMLKLVALKSGQHELVEGNAVSLTQLEDLPLEMQLQVANDDQRRLGLLSPQNNQTKKRSTARRKGHSGSAEKTKRRHSPEAATRAKPTTKDATKAAAAACPSESANDDDAMTASDPGDFYRDNVLPLSIFLDENANASAEAQQQVIDFLCLCVSEHRLQDVVVLLRSIRNRSDTWGQNRSLLNSICKVVDEKVEQVFDAGLDLDWILGR